MRNLIVFFMIAIVGFLVLNAEPADSTVAEDSGGASVLRFWGVYDLPGVYRPIIERFERRHPGVRVEYKLFSSFDEYREVLRVQLKKGDGPDILLFQDQDREWAMDHLLATSAVGLDRFAGFAKQELVIGSLLYALPLWADTMVLYFNEGFYTDGVRPLWYEFAEQARQISISGVAMGHINSLHSGWDILRAIFLQKGIVFQGKVGDTLFDTLEFFLRFSLPKDKYFNWNPSLSEGYPDLEREAFARKKVAAVFGFSPVYDQLRTLSEQIRDRNLRHTIPEKIKVAPFPQFDLQNPTVLGTYVAVGVSLYSKQPNLAWEFVHLLTNEEYSEYLSQATGRISGRILPPQDGDSELQKIQKQQLKFARTFPLSEDRKEKLRPILEKSVKDRTLLREALEINW